MFRAATLLVLLLGCGDDAAPGADGGAPDGGAGVAPDIPWLLADGGIALEVAPPAMEPCPTGWRAAVSESGITTCHPYPEAGPATCGTGEAHFPGEPGCAPAGSACPAGDFAEGLPDDGTVLFVLAGASAGGDGTRGRPYGRIQEALPAVTAGQTIAIGRGRYDEVLTLRNGAVLRGACAAATEIAFSGSDPRIAVINALAGTATLRDLRIGASDRVGLQAGGAGVELTLDGVAIEAAAGVGLYVAGGARVVARGLVVRETATLADGRGGRGLDLFGGSADVHRAVFERNRNDAILATGEDSSLALTDVAIRDTVSGTTFEFGRGMSAQLGASATLTRCLVDGNRDVGLAAAGAGTSIVATDVVVSGTLSEESGRTFGYGLSAQLGAEVEVSRALFTGNRDVGIYGSDEGTVLRFTDVVVRDTAPRESDGAAGRGLALLDGAGAVIARSVFEANHDIALFASEPGSSLDLSDVLVLDTRSQASDLTSGRGLVVQHGATATVVRTRIERSRELGVFVAGEGATLALTDLAILDTTGEERDGRSGRGLVVQLGATATGERAVVDGSGDAGILAYDAGSRVDLEHVAVRGTSADGSGSGGIGVTSVVEAAVTMRRFLVTGNELAGLQLSRGGTLDLHEGEVSRNTIGVNVQTEGFDLARLMDRVVYRENGRDLDSTALPVPDPAVD